MTDMGPRIKEARNEAGLTMERLAEKLDLSKQTVKEWEAGRRQPTVDNLRQLAVILGKTPGWFLDEAPESSAKATLSYPGATEGQDQRLLQMLENQQRLLAEQQAMMERQRQDQQAMMERQRQDVSRLTELLARQQDETIAEREFNRRFASEQIARVQSEIGALRRDFDGLKPGHTEAEKLSGAMKRLEAVERVVATVERLPQPRAREAAAAEITSG